MTEERLEKAERSVTNLVRKALDHMHERYGVDPGALAGGAVAAGVQVSVEDMGPRNTALWLRDVADMLDQAGERQNVDATCAEMLRRARN